MPDPDFKYCSRYTPRSYAVLPLYSMTWNNGPFSLTTWSSNVLFACHIHHLAARSNFLSDPMPCSLLHVLLPHIELVQYCREVPVVHRS